MFVRYILDIKRVQNSIAHDSNENALVCEDDVLMHGVSHGNWISGILSLLAETTYIRSLLPHLAGANTPTHVSSFSFYTFLGFPVSIYRGNRNRARPDFMTFIDRGQLAKSSLTTISHSLSSSSGTAMKPLHCREARIVRGYRYSSWPYRLQLTDIRRGNPAKLAVTLQ